MLSIAITNQKGGVGKTTTCINLAAELGSLGYSVLAVDMDPQGNCTSGLGVEPDTIKTSLYDVLLGGVSIHEALSPTPWEGVTLLPATIDLAGAEVELASIISRETCLRRHMSLLKDFDVAIIDCPPSLGMLTINALVAANKLIVPIQCEYYALEGVGQLARTIGLIRDCLNPDLNIDGVLLTMYDSRTRLANDVVEEVKKQFGEVVFSTVVPRNIKLSEAPSHAMPIAYYEPNCSGAQAYSTFSREVAKRWLEAKAEH
ncbi:MULTISPECIES: ParA family protein [Aminobacterium]|uniref:ParA family protein n=1 Tax=Aminobacterium TaxID=81466 RepID=UPI000463CA9A|nr:MULTISPECIES: AAA family ATPase [Aminobacterium]